jgi:predicted transcriptional regulator
VSKKTSNLPKLGQLELAALEHLWRVGEADVGQTHAVIGKKRGITANTIGSALERLFRKGLVSRHKVSHAFRYSATMLREEFAARRLLEAAGDLEALGSAGLLSAFVDLVADEDAKGLDRLEALIAEKKRQTQ